MIPQTIPTIPPLGERAQDRLVKVLQFGTPLLMMIVVVLAAMTLPAAISGADNSGRVQESTDIAACRALARVPIDESRTEIEALILDGLTAAAVGDLTESSDLLATAADARARLEDATATYKAAIEQSITGPDRFLDDCHRRSS